MATAAKGPSSAWAEQRHGAGLCSVEWTGSPGPCGDKKVELCTEAGVGDGGGGVEARLEDMSADPFRLDAFNILQSFS